MSTITPTSSVASVLNSTTAAATPAAPSQTLTQDDFLKLLTAKMTEQDPMNPQQDTDFIAQMATFSSLQEQKTMETDLSGMRSDQALLQANSLIGRAAQPSDGSNAGVISEVDVVSGTPMVVINGQQYSLDQLQKIAQPNSVQTQP